MADYNVNMKQWNGSSFDNVLPLAYMANNAGKLDGKTYEEIQTYVKDYSKFDFIGTAVLMPPGIDKLTSLDIVVDNKDVYVAFLLFCNGSAINGGRYTVCSDVAQAGFYRVSAQRLVDVFMIYNGPGDYTSPFNNISCASIIGSSSRVTADNNKNRVSDIKSFKVEYGGDVGKMEVCIFGIKK